MLLNAQLKVGCKLKIDNKSILLAQAPTGIQAQVDFGDLQASVPLNADGLYRLYVINHSGDTRGNDWYSDVTCLSIDGTVSMGLTNKGQA